MKIATIIAEFNPLHNGHQTLIKRVKETINPDGIIIVMNGCFTQRGEAAIMDKYTRAKHAILAGADAIIELPTIFGVSCAENFALGGIKIATAIPADEHYLCFGSECGDIKKITSAAKLFLNEPEELKDAISELLDNGFSYPNAKNTATMEYAIAHNLQLPDMTKPNNILAVEYVKAIMRLKSSLIPFTIKRDDNYCNIDAINEISPSAKAIREHITQIDDIKKCVPNFVVEDLSPLSPVGLSAMIMAKLTEYSPSALSKICDINEGLENRILHVLQTSSNTSDLINEVTTKRYTSSRIRRILISALLGIDKMTLEESKQEPAYFKILAIKRAQTKLLSLLNKVGKVYTGESEANESEIKSVKIDVKANELYRIATQSIAKDNGMLVL